MALSRRTGQRFQASIWPGFVDAMTGLLLVLMFVLTIFMVVQFVLRETISGQESKLDALSAEVAALAQALGLEQDRSQALQTQVGTLRATITSAEELANEQSALIATLTRQRDDTAVALAAARTEITSFEAQVAALIAERDTVVGNLQVVESERDALLTEQQALNHALAQARDEIDAQTEAARLAAAQREALDVMIAELQAKAALDAENNAALAAQVTDLEAQLTEEEQARLAQAAAAEALRARLENADAELTAMTLALEEQRKRAEETLTLLAAAEASRSQLSESALAAADRIDREAALRAVAESELAKAEAQTQEEQRKVAVLNAQVKELNAQLGSLQALLDAASERDKQAKVQIAELGSKLNQALAQKVSELSRFRSEFFGKMRDVLGGREGIQVVGDRFVFQSEVLFQSGSAILDPRGQDELTKLADVVRELAQTAPPELNWVLRIDGHTDAVPLRGGRYADNWELSQARALSVVRYLVDVEGIPPSRLAATGFGGFQPIAEGTSPEANDRNRRIEFKFTER